MGLSKEVTDPKREVASIITKNGVREKSSQKRGCQGVSHHDEEEGAITLLEDIGWSSEQGADGRERRNRLEPRGGGIEEVAGGGTWVGDREQSSQEHGRNRRPLGTSEGLKDRAEEAATEGVVPVPGK